MVTELSKQNELSDNKFESKWSIESEMILLLVLVPLDKEEDRKPLAFTALNIEEFICIWLRSYQSKMNCLIINLSQNGALKVK